ncbi:hypothetical protein M8818_005710 [Zalaria obscura]|uniref:Uncharacterized protein n=1 Tax=Zalaria obscura TaxID=2024903 RepID=A0ACC3S8R2_9PEZI
MCIHDNQTAAIGPELCGSARGGLVVFVRKIGNWVSRIGVALHGHSAGIVSHPSHRLPSSLSFSDPQDTPLLVSPVLAVRAVIPLVHTLR